ncbi:MAG: Mur ligase family protein, partial [Rhodothermales bacterium]|nr:Mur ligase family protein [Rhodothermales bacterium]
MMATKTPKRYAEAVKLLLALPRFTDKGASAYRPGLERIRSLLGAMGGPERDYPIVHIAGSNGKGTVASVVASILAASGLRTGLHTSPHILEIGERMRVDGTAANRDWLAANVLRYRGEMDRIKPSFFEMTVALSLLHFSEMKVDAAVVEVGLGGRLDATNAVTPILSVITNIGRDHADILGETVEQIATEKAGIIKAGVPIVTGVSGPAERVIKTVAAERGAPYENVLDTCE